MALETTAAVAAIEAIRRLVGEIETCMQAVKAIKIRQKFWLSRLRQLYKVLPKIQAEMREHLRETLEAILKIFQRLEDHTNNIFSKLKKYGINFTKTRSMKKLWKRRR